MSVMFLNFFAALAFSVPAPVQADVPAPQRKVRVMVTDSTSWEMSGGFAMKEGTGGGAVSGGARPQTVELIKTFGERCPEVTVTRDAKKAQFVVLLDHEGGKGYARRDNKVAVIDDEGDVVFSGSTRSLGNGVKDACEAIKKKAGLITEPDKK